MYVQPTLTNWLIVFFFEHEEVHWDEEHQFYVEAESDENTYESVDDFCGEISYWLSCYYESGHCRHEDEYADRLSFIKFLKVFVPLCSDKPVNLGFTRWIPRKTETEFLF